VGLADALVQIEHRAQTYENAMGLKAAVAERVKHSTGTTTLGVLEDRAGLQSVAKHPQDMVSQQLLPPRNMPRVIHAPSARPALSASSDVDDGYRSTMNVAVPSVGSRSREVQAGGYVELINTSQRSTASSSARVLTSTRVSLDSQRGGRVSPPLRQQCYRNFGVSGGAIMGAPPHVLAAVYVSHPRVPSFIEHRASNEGGQQDCTAIDRGIEHLVQHLDFEHLELDQHRGSAASMPHAAVAGGVEWAREAATSAMRAGAGTILTDASQAPPPISFGAVGNVKGGRAVRGSSVYTPSSVQPSSRQPRVPQASHHAAQARSAETRHPISPTGGGGAASYWMGHKASAAPHGERAHQPWVSADEYGAATRAAHGHPISLHTGVGEAGQRRRRRDIISEQVDMTLNTVGHSVNDFGQSFVDFFSGNFVPQHTGHDMLGNPVGNGWHPSSSGYEGPGTGCASRPALAAGESGAHAHASPTHAQAAIGASRPQHSPVHLSPGHSPHGAAAANESQSQTAHHRPFAIPSPPGSCSDSGASPQSSGYPHAPLSRGRTMAPKLDLTLRPDDIRPEGKSGHRQRVEVTDNLKERIEGLRQSLFTEAHTSSEQVATDFEDMLVKVRRGAHIVDDTLAVMGDWSEARWRQGVVVHFDGEMGIDCGALTREWAKLLCQQLLRPGRGLFRRTARVYFLKCLL